MPSFVLSEMEVITPNGFEMPYTGRPYVFGIFDCWMLCRDYLKREFNIEINANAHLHIPSWYLGDDDILDLNYRNENLVRLAHGEEPQKGDIFFIQYGKMPDHCAVYVGDNRIPASPNRQTQQSRHLRWHVPEKYYASFASSDVINRGRKNV